jgi:hypothetical protein
MKKPMKKPTFARQGKKQMGKTQQNKTEKTPLSIWEKKSNKKG